MKSLKNYLFILAFTLFVPSVWAQFGTNIINSTELYFTGFNTNYTWTNISLEVDAGYQQIPGGFAASKLDGLFRFGSTKQYGLGGNIQFSGVGSAINGAEAEFAYSVIQHYDLKLDLVGQAGYDDTVQNSAGARVGSWVVEPGLDIAKKGTPNTYEKVKITWPVYGVGKFQTSPRVEAAVGFTFP